MSGPLPAGAALGYAVLRSQSEAVGGADSMTTTGVAVILAAGRGTRMNSRLAKVLHPLLGRTLAGWVVSAAREAGLDSVLVVHHQEEAVRAALAGPGVRFVRQAQPRGTGDAVAAALPALPEAGPVVVACGDAPLVRGSTLRALLAAHAGSPHPVTVVTARLPDPAAYGRIVRDDAGIVTGIVEAAHCTPDQLAIDEINTGLYVFDAAYLREALPRLQPHHRPGKAPEYYLTDLVEMAGGRGGAGALVHDDIDELMGINDKWALAEARAVLQERILRAHAMAGVTFQAPATTRVTADVRLGMDVTVGPDVVLEGHTVVGEGTTIGKGCVLTDAAVAGGVVLHPYCVLQECRVATGVSVGPFARLRPAADIGEGAKVGNFVEIKKTRVEPGAKVPHLSYVGDATVGAKANVGAGTITCNYDGFGKHHTEIGAGAFIGSNTSLVAPVRVGAGAIVGAGSVIVSDVPDDALALGRGRQVDKPDAAPGIRARAQAAKAAKERS